MSRSCFAWVWASCFVTLVALVVSCGTREERESPGDNRDALQQTITLQSPKGVPVLSPVLESSNGLALGAFSKVNPTSPVVAMGTAGTRVEPDANLNALWSRGATRLGDRVHVFGRVYSSSITLGNNVVIDGGTNKTPVFDPTEKLTWTVVLLSAGGLCHERLKLSLM